MHDITRRAVFGGNDADPFLSDCRGGIHLREHVVYFYVIIGSPSASDRKEQLHRTKVDWLSALTFQKAHQMLVHSHLERFLTACSLTQPEKARERPSPPPVGERGGTREGL